MSGSVVIEPVRDDAGVAAASRLAREFFAYMRATYPEHEAAVDAYLIAQDFEGQLADFRSHFNPPRGECLLATLDGEPVGIVMLKPYADGRLRAEPHVRRPAPPAAAASGAGSARR